MALHAFWVHGTITEVENPDALAPVAPDAVQAAFTRHGWGAQFIGQTNSRNWFHIPITTPVLINGVRPKLGKVFVLFKTQGNVVVTDLHLYDGGKKVKEIKAFEGFTGDHSGAIDGQNTWIINPPLTLSFGLGISVGVDFRTPPANFPFPSILFTTAGADFTTP